MQTQDLIIIAFCLTSALLLMDYYARKPLLQAFDRHYAASNRDHKMEHRGHIAALRREALHGISK